MKILETRIGGCFEITPKSIKDNRGTFFKTYHIDLFQEFSLETKWVEEYFSTSKKNVIRGMHFQVPPDEHAKLVTCLSGSVLDVVIDLRKESSSYKKCISFELNDQNIKMIYIPKGCAHGFLSFTDDSLMFYKVSSIYNPENDRGVLWNSIGFGWPVDQPIISNRDLTHPSLNDFLSPF